MLSSADREAFAFAVMDEVRRWPGVQLRPHPSSTEPGEADGVEFRLFGRQFGHVHASCDLHLSLTRALKDWVVSEQLAEPLELATTAGWASFQPMSVDDAQQAIWLLRLNYVRLRRQRLTPVAAAGSELLQQHEAALSALRPGVSPILQRTQARSSRRPLPGLES
ncbi:MAG: hypothetical protein JWL60_1852 [Gemmatimonadetes bacterium]|jgi:hypothetical protein|nr:hypothetical protein [Gemmatimonadota bacterium]